MQENWQQDSEHFCCSEAGATWGSALRSPEQRTWKENVCSPSLPPRKAIRRGGQGAPSLWAVLLHSDMACHLWKERKIKQEDGDGAVTSTVHFLFSSVTLGQVKAGTSNFITLVLACLCTHSVCGRPWFISQQRWKEHLDGLGRTQQALFFPLRTHMGQAKCPDQLHPVCTHVQVLGSPLISRLSSTGYFLLQELPSLQNLCCLFLRVNLDSSYCYCWCSFTALLWTLPFSHLQRAAAAGILFINPLQAQADLHSRLLAPGSGLAFGANTLATCRSA